MRNKFIALLILGTSLILSAPVATAADIPLLTWERGKEQNIVLGGYTNQSTWKISLVGKGIDPIEFRKSSINKAGYVVYSIAIPRDFPTGVYSVETSGKGSPKTVVAGIRVVDLIFYEILRVPAQLLFLLIVLVFLVTTLSTLRLSRYEHLAYLQSKSEVKLPSIFSSFYRLRRNSVAGVQKSLFKHVIKKEGELLHKISPSLWAVVPVLTFIFGIFIGLSTGTKLGIPNIPLYLFLIAAVVGVIDPYSGFTATIGFGVIQTSQGNIGSVRGIGALISIGLAWVAPGIISSIYRETIGKDSKPDKANSFLPELFAAISSGAIFFSCELLISSLLNRVGPIVNSRFDLPLIIALAVVLKSRIERRLDRKALVDGSIIEVKSLVLSRVISPRATSVLTIFFGGVAYIWTESLAFAIATAVLLTVPLAALQVRFESPKLEFFSRIKRGILVESTIVAAVSAAIFFVIQSLPFEVVQKGKLIILGAAIPLIIHSIFSSLGDINEREKVKSI